MTWVFGEFELDESLFELRRAGTRVALRPKPLKLLFHLALNCSRVVPTEELLQTLWPGVSVTEVSLRQTVRSLRRALGDDAGKQIISLRGHGYRLQASVVRRLTGIAADGRDAPARLAQVLSSVIRAEMRLFLKELVRLAAGDHALRAEILAGERPHDGDHRLSVPANNQKITERSRAELRRLDNVPRMRTRT